MQDKKLSLIISSYDDIKNPYYAGGGALAVHAVAKRLAKQYDVCVLTGKYPGCTNEVIDGVRYERVGLARFGGKFGQIAFQLCLPWLVLTRSYDIWLESFTPPFSTTFLQVFTARPVIGIVHMLSGEDMRRKYKLPFDLIEKIGLQSYTHLIVLSETMKKKLLRINPRLQIAVIPNGVEIRLPENAEKTEKQYILFLGRIEVNQKGLDLLLTAYSTLAESIPYPLYIAGSGNPSEEKQLRERIAELSLTRKVKLLGRVTGRAKDELFFHAVCAVVPSRYESFSMTALETVAHGIPLVCFSIEGLSHLPEDVALKVPPFDVTKLSRAIAFITSHPEAAAILRKNGLAFAQKFNWDEVAKQYKEYITEVVQ